MSTTSLLIMKRLLLRRNEVGTRDHLQSYFVEDRLGVGPHNGPKTRDLRWCCAIAEGWQGENTDLQPLAKTRPLGGRE